MKTVVIALSAALFSSILSLTLAGQAQVAKTPSSIAYVSASRVLRETTHGRSEAARVQQIQQQRTNELRTKQQTLEATRQELTKATDEANRLRLQQQELQQRTDFERASAQLQIDLQNLQREANSDMAARVRATVDELMKTQTYQLVLNSDATLIWSSPELDLTDAVIARMNGQ
jgi:outer membrane protein